MTYWTVILRSETTVDSDNYHRDYVVLSCGHRHRSAAAAARCRLASTSPDYYAAQVGEIDGATDRILQLDD